MHCVGDLYCGAWDLFKAKHPTREEKREARLQALDRVALASMCCDGILKELEER